MVLHNLRGKLGLSQTALGEALGVTQSLISRYERSELPGQYIPKLCVVLGITVDRLEAIVHDHTVEDDFVANEALRLIASGVSKRDVVSRLSAYMGIPRQRVLGALATVPVDELNQLSGDYTPGGFVDSTTDLRRWEHKLKTTPLEMQTFSLLLRITTFLDPLSWIAVGTFDEIRAIEPNITKKDLETLHESGFVDRIGNAEFVYRLRFPEEEKGEG